MRFERRSPRLALAPSWPSARTRPPCLFVCHAPPAPPCVPACAAALFVMRLQRPPVRVFVMRLAPSWPSARPCWLPALAARLVFERPLALGLKTSTCPSVRWSPCSISASRHPFAYGQVVRVVRTYFETILLHLTLRHMNTAPSFAPPSCGLFLTPRLGSKKMPRAQAPLRVVRRRLRHPRKIDIWRNLRSVENAVGVAAFALNPIDSSTPRACFQDSQTNESPITNEQTSRNKRTRHGKTRKKKTQPPTKKRRTR